jgi:hypothetical protein
VCGARPRLPRRQRTRTGGIDYGAYNDEDGEDDGAPQRWASFRKVADRASSRGCGANNHGNRDGVPYEPSSPYAGASCTCWKHAWDSEVNHDEAFFDPRLYCNYMHYAEKVLGRSTAAIAATVRWLEHPDEHPDELAALVDAELKRRHDSKRWSTKADGHCFDDDSDSEGSSSGGSSNDDADDEGCLDDTD